MPKKKYSINWENDEAQSFEVNGVTYESLDDVPDWKDRDKLAAMLHASSEEGFEEVKFDEKEFEELRKAAAKAKELDLNTGSMTYLRLGQCYDMKQKREDALSAYRAAISIAPDSDAARQSRQYLSSPYKRKG